MDRFTTDVIQGSLIAIANEMFAVLKRTAMSPIIYEVLDAGVAVTDAAGRLASSGAGIPSFINVLDKSINALIAEISVDSIQPGDVYCNNDPYRGGVTHSSDVIIMVPVFSDGCLIAWTANIAHWSDIGGAIPGSLPTDATDIFCEGLRLPLIQLIKGGKEISGVFSIMRVNSRLPDILLGDLWAGISAARRGELRIGEVVKRYGVDAFIAAIEDSFQLEEKRVLSGLEKLDMGRYCVQEIQDDGSTLSITVIVDRNSLVIDLTDAPDQDPGPYNTSRDSAIIAGQMLLKVITTPGSSANDGSFRALKVRTRRGSCFDPIEPAAQGYYFEVRMRLFDMLLKCVAEGMPDRFPAGHFASICGTVVSGFHPDHRRRFTMVEPQMGGWGACRGRDGVDAIFSLTHGETYRCPAEISEARYGIDVERVSFNSSPGGMGQWRGGRGLLVEYRMRGMAELSVGYSRSIVPPWGLAGGETGSHNYVEVHKESGEYARYSSKSGIKLEKGDLVRIHTGSGGGWGVSELREQLAITDDECNELQIT